MRPRRQFSQGTRNAAIERLDILILVQSLTVGWVGDHAAVFVFAGDLLEGSLLKMDLFGQSSLSGMVACQLEYLGVDISSNDV
ncbi:MAG: hypothetical protein WBF93_19575 [Pirellulales bacterium]